MTTESRTSLTEVERLKLEMESLRGLLQRSIEERGRLERANRELSPVMHNKEINTLRTYVAESDSARAKIQKEHDELEQEMADLRVELYHEKQRHQATRAELEHEKERGMAYRAADITPAFQPIGKPGEVIPYRRGFSFPAWVVFAGVLLLWAGAIVGIVWWLFFSKHPI